MSQIEEAKKQVYSSEAFKKAKQFFPELDFDEELEQNPELAVHILKSLNQQMNSLQPPEEDPKAPKLDEDFSKYFVINNLPKCDKEKAKKLVTLLLKLFQKKNVTITEDKIDMPFGEDGFTKGCAFILAASEEQAKFAAAIMNDHKLDKNHTFAAAQIGDFLKIMQTQEDQQVGNVARLIDLRAPLMDTRREQYYFQSGKSVTLKWFEGHRTFQTQDNKKEQFDEQVTKEAIHTDRAVKWSPKGTYLIIIKSDKVEFLGGPKMDPIITIPDPKVENVLMSPCERYLLTYAPQSKDAYNIWDFQQVKIIRSFEQQIGETIKTYKWSYDGNYLAKIFSQEKHQGNEVKIKTGISVYTLPSMDLLETSDGAKKSITIDGVSDFEWSPISNFFVYSAFPGENQLPTVAFMEIPSRNQLAVRALAYSQKVRINFHPDGSFLAILNEFKEKRTTKYSIELFDTKKPAMPHQQILIQREVYELYGAYWEPNGSKIAIHTNSKRIVEGGKKDYQLDQKRQGVDIYEMIQDSLQGFTYKLIGFLSSEKVQALQWSGCGDLFSVFETEGMSKLSVSFFMILKDTSQQQAAATAPVAKKGATLVAKEEKFEFRKIAKHDVTDSKAEAVWDPSGRYLAVYGINVSSLRPGEKSLRFYNILGDPLGGYEKLPAFSGFKWRPKPTDILQPREIQKLKQEYKNKYVKRFKEEEKSEKSKTTSLVKANKKKIKDEFLKNFFLPLREEFESQREKYVKLWPIRNDDIVEVEQEVIYAFDNVVQEVRL